MTIHLTEQEIEDLQLAANEHHTTVEDLILEAIRERLFR